jgi:hypothetical protein
MRQLLLTFRYFVAASAAILSVAGCNFERADDGAVELNVCRAQDQCRSDAECRNGMCMARATDGPLSIAVEVTQRRSPNANEALPFLFEPFVVEKPIARLFELPESAVLGGTVRDNGKKIAASVSFTPTTLVSGVATKAITASTVAGVIRNEADYQVQLIEGVQYRMLVRPNDARHPPVSRTLIAARDIDLDIEYAALQIDQRWFTISGGPTGGQLLVTAFDPRSGDPVSSTATVSGGKAQLLFAPGVEDFRIEIRSSQTYSAALVDEPGSSPCDSRTPAYPVFSINDDQLGIDPNGIGKIALPAQPQRIRYEGRVDLCSDDATNPADIGNLLITLHSQQLLIEPPPGLLASYNATTNASYDADSRELRFCVEVIPGEYEIVVTPPSSMQCSLFAERRLIKAPSEEVKAVGTALELPATNYLSGYLQTMEPAPLKGASIEGIALGRNLGDALSATDPRITRFNRSRQTTSNAQGSFELPVDFGSYDIVIKPPASSGFPWQIRHDMEILQAETGDDEFPTTIEMVSPVSLEGMLRYSGKPQDARVDGAAVEVYALVPDGADGRRAISIGKATADADGNFTILLPPSTKKNW